LLFVAGNIADRACFVLSGYVSPLAENEIGRDITVVVNTRGETVHPESLVTQIYTCRAKTTADSTISYLPKSVFFEVMHGYPRLAMNVLSGMAVATSRHSPLLSKPADDGKWLRTLTNSGATLALSM
jgi:CRP-like cAMP-binding protein